MAWFVLLAFWLFGLFDCVCVGLLTLWLVDLACYVDLGWVMLCLLVLLLLGFVFVVSGCCFVMFM